ncbi:hypothetical protein ASH02_10575 [Nocardioides sp. Soil796]|nr:hypothetical protein ASH02_10575 [Nocardioides sp. Soil796]
MVHTERYGVLRILVTNDDGIREPGLIALAGELTRAGHEVHVLGPARERSGSSAGFATVVDHARIPIEPVVLDGLPGITARAIDAPPALAVKAACAGAFDWTPELVVSGINPGFNTGRMVLHSGTVGAALTAVSHDVPGLAVSTARADADGFATAAVLAAWLVELAEAESLPPIALNLNVPALPLAELDGISAASFSDTSVSDVGFVLEGDAFVVHRWQNQPPFTPGTDAAHLHAGWATLSAVSPPWASAGPVDALADALCKRWIDTVRS